MLGDTVSTQTQPVNGGHRVADDRLPVTALGLACVGEPLESPCSQPEHIGAILARVVDGLIEDADRRLGLATESSIYLRRLGAALKWRSPRGAA